MLECLARSLSKSSCAGILYQDTYARDLTGAHVEMRSLEVGGLPCPSVLTGSASQSWRQDVLEDHATFCMVWQIPCLPNQ